MEPRLFKPRVLEVAVLLAGIAVAIYAFSVIRDVGATTPDSGTAATLGTTPSPSPSPSPSATPSKAAPTEPPRLGPFRQATAKAKRILVVGDSTGSDLGEWVDLWAQDLAKTRAVTLHRWDPTAAQFAAFPTIYGTGSALEIWNLSYAGVKADYAQRLKSVPPKPDVVILNVGHDRGRAALQRTIRSTTKAIDKRWGGIPVAVILQNPSTGAAAKPQETAVAFVKTLATKDRFPVVDVHAAFRKAGQLDTLLVDGSNPNAAGSRLWADAVEKALGR